MKYIITGGCGFLGSNIAKELIEKGEEIVIFDNLSRIGAEKNLGWLNSVGKFKFIHGDIRNQNDVDRLIKQELPDVIYHLAGQVAMTTSIANPRLDFEINTMGSFNVLEAVRKYKKDVIVVYSSTNKVYGDIEWIKYKEMEKRYICDEYSKGFTEEIPLEFCSPYGTSKGSADQYMLDYYRIFGIRTVVFRHSSMYGGRQFATYDQGWVGWFCQQAIEQKKGMGKEYTISGSGKQVRDLLHAEDMVELYTSVVKYIDKTKGQAYNIGGGMENSLSLLELFDILESELDIKLKYLKIANRESDQKIFVANLEKITSHIGWKPKIDKITGLKKMIKWVEEINSQGE